MSQSIRVGLIDGDPDIRFGRRLAISATPGMEIVFEAETATEALAKAPNALIDCLVIDYRTRGLDGLSLARRLIEEYLARGESVPAIIVTAPYFTPQLQIESIRAGASDLITQDASIEELLKSIRTSELKDEEPDYSELARFFESSAVTVTDSASLLIKIGFLDERERAALASFQRRNSDSEIAADVDLPLYRVRKLMRQVMHKCGFATRAQLFLALYEAGLIEGEQIES